MDIVALVVNPTDAPSQDDARWIEIGRGVGIWVKPNGGDNGIDVNMVVVLVVQQCWYHT